MENNNLENNLIQLNLTVAEFNSIQNANSIYNDLLIEFEEYKEKNSILITIDSSEIFGRNFRYKGLTISISTNEELKDSELYKEIKNIRDINESKLIQLNEKTIAIIKLVNKIPKWVQKILGINNMVI